jgi:hypothetical protein
MKRRSFASIPAALPGALIAALLGLLLDACISAPPREAPALDRVVHRWITGLYEEDIELLMSAYWPEAEALGLGTQDEGAQLRQGREAIREMQLSAFEHPAHHDLHIVEVDREVERTSAVIRLHVVVPDLDLTILNTLEFQRRGDEWKIIYQTVEPLIPE